MKRYDCHGSAALQSANQVMRRRAKRRDHLTQNRRGGDRKHKISLKGKGMKDEMEGGG